MGVLRVNVGGQWIDIPGGADEVFIGPSDPGLTYELWFDTDASTPPPTGTGLPAGGAAGMVLTKATATDFDATWVSPRQVIEINTTASFTPWVTNEGHMIVFTSNLPTIGFSIPLNSSQPFPVGARIDMAQVGTGKITVSADPAATLYATPSKTLRAQGSVASVTKIIAPDTWLLFGDLA